MEIADLVSQLRADGARLAGVVADTDLDARVPTCPDWELRDLVRHVGGVHRWATGFVRNVDPHPQDGDLEEIVGGWPDDDELVAWFRAGHGDLVAALDAAPSDLETWTFLEAPSPLAFWARRQAHETAIHRVDAESASERVSGFPAAFAADGIDELVLRFASRPGRELPVDRPRAMVVQAPDADRRWRIGFAPEGFDNETVPTSSDADLTVTGSASDLYLWLWNRRDALGLQAIGDRELLDLWRDAVRIRWS
jgi:uncharacterized protein (TIGR03083 family)